MHSFFVLALAFGIVAGNLVSENRPMDNEDCYKLKDAFAEVEELAIDAMFPCTNEHGRARCAIFNSMYVSSFRKIVSRVAADIMCTDIGKLNVAEACDLLSNIGQLATKDLVSVFSASKKSPLAGSAKLVIPMYGKLSEALVYAVKENVCSFV